MNITEFHSNFGAFGSAMRSNRFKLVIPTPEIMINSQNIARQLEYWCEQVQLPGYLIGTHDVRRWTYGPLEKRPHTPQTVQLQATFLSNGHGDVWDFFNEWMQAILPHTSVSGSVHGINAPYGAGQRQVYELSYKKEYATDLHVEVYDTTGRRTFTVVCREAFPTQVPEAVLNWGDINGILRFQVMFEYLDWYVLYNNVDHNI